MGSSIGVGLIGLGTVGSGVVRLLRDAPAAMHALGDRRRHPVGGNHDRGHQGGGFFRGMAKICGPAARGFATAAEPQASGAHSRSMTSSMVTPSARAANVSAMR